MFSQQLNIAFNNPYNKLLSQLHKPMDNNKVNLNLYLIYSEDILNPYLINIHKSITPNRAPPQLFIT
jgi:hypothetical protein